MELSYGFLQELSIRPLSIYLCCQRNITRTHSKGGLRVVFIFAVFIIHEETKGTSGEWSRHVKHNLWHCNSY